ncbi:Mariner Mos1 transposase like protein [Argiope bruennichi]|uniref:Mariner Mos1 transposase like protein n=1 Tax=Argiope bruennichi TaxID=94029 RepID=A0A8T0FTQ6_ARGBR|nr:Mariner Mos1 transposase like protein [Argiope bruennichi]
MDQKLQCITISELYNSNPNDSLQGFVPVNETWIHHYTPEPNSNQNSRNSTKNTKSAPSARKVIATVFWDVKRILPLDYLERGRTINAEYYANLLDKLDSKVKEKRSHLAKMKVIFHQDNAFVLKTVIVMAKLHELKFEILPHALCSPDIPRECSDDFEK